MFIGLVTGIVLGAATVFLIFQNLMRKKEVATSDEAKILTGAARRATTELAKLSLTVQGLEKGQLRGSDLIKLFPDLVKKVLTCKDSDEVVKSLNRATQSLLKAEETSIFLADRTGARLCLASSSGFTDKPEEQINLGLGEGFVGLAAETGRLLFRGDLENESVLVRRNMIMSDIPGFKPDYAAPMLVEGILYGIITAGDFEGPSVLRVETLRALAAVGAAALENVRKLERLARSSTLDPDTGFLGKHSLEFVLDNELERVERFGSNLAIIELNFKFAENEKHNDTKDIMKVASEYIHSSLRNIDIGLRLTISRILLLLPGTDSEGMNWVMGKLGGEIPQLTLNNGTLMGSVHMKCIEVNGGSRYETHELLKKLEQEETKEFEGYYET